MQRCTEGATDMGGHNDVVYSAVNLSPVFLFLSPLSSPPPKSQLTIPLPPPLKRRPPSRSSGRCRCRNPFPPSFVASFAIHLLFRHISPNGAAIIARRSSSLRGTTRQTGKNNYAFAHAVISAAKAFSLFLRVPSTS